MNLTKKSKTYLKNNQYRLPIKINDDIWVTTCFGIPYSINEFDKCSGYKVKGIHIYEDGIYFDIEKNRDNQSSRIPLDYLDKFFFTSAEKAKEKLIEFSKYDKDIDVFEKYLEEKENEQIQKLEE